ncbi:uncharacterized protein BJ171DRAFT_472945 [Polychytrium aggregatum]|uniref:uncharacterized protein n=1 Tax=Polychytrium aggregatum TaxID=110093 RepID=UPI0022FE1036|nr:uncharacterized protein BJ171DRAFT_472945 [Polychytrium aggregatum]KAI9206962.1 hypothetical protein BJ171DRAFT_472945 [Polychytrium aggregatum]
MELPRHNLDAEIPLPTPRPRNGRGSPVSTASIWSGSSARASRAREIKTSSLSAETQGLFKYMMKSSRLSHSQQRYLDELVKDGYSLPPTPSQASITQVRGPIPRPISLGIFEQKPADTFARPGLRTRDQIVMTGAYEPDEWRPSPHKDSSKEKDRLQNLMANGFQSAKSASGDDDIGIPVSKLGRRRAGAKAIEHTDQAPELDEFEMVVEEINERRKWLDDMIALGRGEPFKRQIQNEIALVSSCLGPAMAQY